MGMGELKEGGTERMGERKEGGTERGRNGKREELKGGTERMGELKEWRNRKEELKGWGN